MIKLKTKITLGLLGIFALTAALILLWGTREIGPALIGAEEKAVRNIFKLIELHVTEAYSNMLDAEILAITQRKNLLAGNMALAETAFERLRGSGLDRESAQQAAIDWFLQVRAEKNQDWRIIDADGGYLEPVDAGNQSRSAFAIKDLSGRPAVEDIATGRTGRDSGFVVFADPLRGKKFLGFFQRYAPWNWTIAQILELDDIEKLTNQAQQQVLERLQDSFAQIKLPGHGSVFLFDSLGQLLVMPQPESAAISPQLQKLQQHIIERLSRQADSSEPVHFTEEQAGTSFQVYASYLRAFDSYACIVIPTSAIVGPVNQLLERQTLSVCLVFALGLMLAMEFARRITMPLLRLVATMREVTLTDNYRLRSQETSSDEIGQLAAGFNQMLNQIDARDQKLEQYQHFLEQKVTERTLSLRKTISDLEQANQQAEVANRAKSAFLANVTHELRTPMIGVLGMNELLAESLLTSRQRDLTAAVNRAGNQMLELINQILDFSLLESGGFELHREEVDLQLLSEEVVEQFAEKAGEKELTLLLNISPQAAWRVQSDARRLRQLLENLIDNAIKFTPEGQVTVSLSRRQDGCFVYRIADTGIGIEPQNQEIIFSIFKQLDETSARAFSGTGLGLSIVRVLMQLMQGELRVESVPQQGSLFEVALPLEPVEQLPLFPSEIPLPSRVLFGATPSPSTEACESLLKNMGMTPERSTQNSHEILQTLQQASPPFDLVILAAGCPLADQESLLTQAARACRHVVCLRHRVRENTAIPGVLNVFQPGLRRELIKICTREALTVPAIEDACLVEKSSANLENFEQFPRILIVDDHIVTLELIRLSLQKAALHFDEARNAEEVLHAVAHTDYRLILMDINLPGTDGLQLTRKLRAQGFSAPICALTAHDVSVIGEQCLQAGMQELLRKPFRQAELFALLEKYLGQTGQPVVTQSRCAGGER